MAARPPSCERAVHSKATIEWLFPSQITDCDNGTQGQKVWLWCAGTQHGGYSHAETHHRHHCPRLSLLDRGIRTGQGGSAKRRQHEQERYVQGQDEQEEQESEEVRRYDQAVRRLTGTYGAAALWGGLFVVHFLVVHDLRASTLRVCRDENPLHACQVVAR